VCGNNECDDLMLCVEKLMAFWEIPPLPPSPAFRTSDPPGSIRPVSPLCLFAALTPVLACAPSPLLVWHVSQVFDEQIPRPRPRGGA